MFGVCAGPNLERDRNLDGIDHALEDTPNQRFIGEQGRPCGFLAYLFGRAAHIDVDNVCTQLGIEARRFSQLLRVVTDYLHRAEACTGAVLLSFERFARSRQPEVGGLHFAHSQSGTQLDGEFAHGKVSDPCHRRKEHII